ncbi:hypothetical protein BGZ83_006140 [Gryganskiella cystojenkinii]|nr:hypothetical protein BGZ83_006140 [Gryganskiella cystojenkinii]
MCPIFCNDKFAGVLTVSLTKMLEFFQQVVFNRTVHKVVLPNAGYSGQVGMSAPTTTKTTVELDDDEVEDEDEDKDKDKDDNVEAPHAHDQSDITTEGSSI